MRDWNLQHGETRAARLELVRWRTHTHPEAAGRAQASINRQALAKCDLVVGIIWSRLGSPTGRSVSGTVEEIKLGVKGRKQVIVYFSERPVPGEPTDDPANVAAFKEELGQKAYWWAYKSVESFESDFRNHLAAVMNELIGKKG